MSALKIITLHPEQGALDVVTKTVGIALLSLSPLEFLDRDSWMMFSLRVDFHPFIPAWEWVVIHRIVVVPGSKTKRQEERLVIARYTSGFYSNRCRWNSAAAHSFASKFRK